jgi:tryptophanyl-tRNA synthetase
MGKTGSSDQGTVRILDDPDAIRRKFKTAVTDSGREVRRAPDKPGITNLIDILSVVSGDPPETIEARFDGEGYGAFKEAVGEAVVTLLTPIRKRYDELRADEGELVRLLELGAGKARETAAPTLAAMYERMGFVSRR